MELGKQITENITDFIFAGKAIFTLKSLKTGKHYTYKVSKGTKYFFVSVRYGDEWTDIGSFRKTDMRAFPTWGTSTFSPSMKALSWFLNHIDSDQIEFYHMGKCAACGRALTNPESIETGFGPICAEKIL